MTFIEAGNFQIPRALFIAAWKVWFKRFSDDHYAWREGKMPLRNENKPLHQLLSDNYRFSVEVLSRLMVPWSFRDKRQVTDELIRLNPAVLRCVSMICERSGESIEGARLTDQALDFWDSLTYIEQDLHLNFAEARIQADIESPSSEPCILDDAGIELIGEDIYPPVVPNLEASDEDFVKALVAWIDEDPFQPLYQKKPVGDAVSGWHDRLLAFFWPKPRTGYLEYSHAASPLVYRAQTLAESVLSGESWDYENRELAVKTANEIFMLAGVPQREVTWQNVRSVIESALSADGASKAKMNSGWTYLASLATSIYEQQLDKLPLVSWNSRCSSSVLSRLDFLLSEAGSSNLGERFKHLGSIPGSGGTRPRAFSLEWPSAYRSWKSIIAASRLVRMIVNELNSKTKENGELYYKPMPLPGGKKGPWTSRGVQLVLFFDGY